MMENQSFDKILGYVKGVGKLTGKEYCLNQKGEKIYVAPGADIHNNNLVDYPHSHQAFVEQMWAQNKINNKLPNGSGFIKYNFPKNDPIGEKNYMSMYDSENFQLPALMTLAQNFITCDRWFCSYPGATGPNRLFVHCTTSGGYAGNIYQASKLHPPKEMQSLFESIHNKGLSWKIYFDDDLSTAQCFPFVKQFPQNNVSMKVFFNDVNKQSLPNYSVVTPKLKEESQHGGNDNMLAGDDFIRQVFMAIRKSKFYWNKTLLIITYDESGGLYDSVMPQFRVAKPTAFKSSQWPPEDNIHFDFDYLGPRVPTVLVSSWFDACLDSTQYEHSSIPGSLKILWNLKSPGPDAYLTVRDKNANNFLSFQKYRTHPRQDVIEV